jgi:basic membrane protein A
MRLKQWFPLVVAILCLWLPIGCAGYDLSRSAARNSDGSESSKNHLASESIKVLHYVSGKLGDKGFFDSAERGIKKAQFVFGFETLTIEADPKPAVRKSELDKLAASETYDVIVVSGMMEDVKELSGRYPKQRFIYYDGSIGGRPNVYTMRFSQSEGSFLAGAFAAMVTTSSSIKGTNSDKRIGFIGGMVSETINDFKYGYEQGAIYIDPDIQVIASYVGDFVNKGKAKELAAMQYTSQKVDIIYNVAGLAGIGGLKAGHEAGKYTIGVDNNQNSLYPGSVLTSMLKNVDESVFRALSKFRGGSLPFGGTEVLSIKEGGVGIARDELYEKYVPEQIKEEMKAIEFKIANGEIKVKSILAE